MAPINIFSAAVTGDSFPKVVKVYPAESGGAQILDGSQILDLFKTSPIVGETFQTLGEISLTVPDPASPGRNREVIVGSAFTLDAVPFAANTVAIHAVAEAVAANIPGASEQSGPIINVVVFAGEPLGG
ncbi:hypothetical protein A2160_01850 [Candidatus Beckwithbacteria bacterium RBG_13_42_9]|uniref:Uncharacterized protein n=1 Tax=Candidatus Beckwithbacteria bacterium RBG_13_42_9 TaxID=1797457 RepID=A0A1F5E869_9BACT|nr:MAG: hypothetical protein A2160_01850 [Candidatus Beckwithbacteria bacterium RBG_13_42_9]